MALKKNMIPVYAKRTVAAVFLVLVVWAFFGGHRLAHVAVELQAAPAVLRNPWVFVPVFLVGTALVGRFFCETMCPLGILQSLVNWIFHPKNGVRRVCTRLPETTAQRIVRWSVAAAFFAFAALGCGAIAYSVEPYSILGRALTLLGPYPLVVAAILAAAAVGSGRIWCNWICPLGTIFALVGRIAPWGNRIGPRCANCRRCFPATAAKEPARDGKPAPDGIGRREVLKGVAVLAVAEKTTDGGLADIVMPERAKRKRSVLPPGALSRSAFGRECLACGLCIKACPQHVLVPSTKSAAYGQPELDFNRSCCSAECDRQCAKACPAGAIERLEGVGRLDVHIGVAVWDAEKCIRTDGTDCTICSRKCPVKAVTIVEGIPVVDDVKCIGCGICEHFCAARPEPAIVVEGLDNQRAVRRVGA